MAGFFSRLKSIFSGHSAIDEDFYEELEETLIMGDMGSTATEEVMEERRRQVKERRVKGTEDCRELLKESIKEQDVYKRQGRLPLKSGRSMTKLR